MNKLIFLFIIVAVIFIVKEFFNKKPNSDKPKAFQKLLYRKKRLMTETELSFFRTLEQKYNLQYYIIPQVLLSSIIEVDLPRSFYAYKGYRSKIDKKVIDFILFNKQDFSPVVAIELDDTSHLKPEAYKNDNFKNQIFDKLEINLVRIKVAQNYDLSEIDNAINGKRKTHILHVDDDQFILDLYKPLFEKEGYKVTNILLLNTDFMERVINIKPDLIICDTVMPHINGIEFLKAIKSDERTKNIPFVFLSNSGDQASKDQAEQFGAVEYLIKAELRPNDVVSKMKVLMI